MKRNHKIDINKDYIENEEEEDNNDQEENDDKDTNLENKKSPKYHRNNILIHKSNIHKKKINRSQREENPLKSVAQKIKNSTLKKEKIDLDKDNEEDEQFENEEDEQGIEDIQDLDQDEDDDINEVNTKKNEKEKIEIPARRQNQFKPVEKQINSDYKNIVNVPQEKKYISPREK